jgi:hypothetical protein
MVAEKPKLLFQASVQRQPYFRRFRWWAVSAVAAVGATIALDLAGRRLTSVSQNVLLTGQVVALALVVLAAYRALTNLLRGLRRKDETVLLFDKGFVWTRGKDEYKYGWGQVVSFREGVRSLYVAGRPILQVGAQVLKMRDGRVFRFTGIQGDTRRFARIVRPIVAEIAGGNMARALRDHKMIRIHPDLTVLPVGVKAGKQQIRWEDLDIVVKNGKLLIKRKTKKGDFKTARSFDTHQIDNLGGFMEVAVVTIRNHQPERFNIKVQGAPRRAR